VGLRPVLFEINSPSDLVLITPATVATNSMLPSFYQAQVPAETDWNRESFISIKRAGLYSNFADGLVQKLGATRITMTITAAVYTPVAYPGTISYAVGDNAVTIAGLASPVSGPVGIYDESAGYPYFTQYGSLANGPNYLTDNARRTAAGETLFVFPLVTGVTQKKSFTLTNVATLNTMYESEIFFPYCPTAAYEKLFLSCQLNVDSDALAVDFLTKSIDPVFNTDQICFDSVIEVEVTPV
jgi:hypothetical protein